MNGGKDPPTKFDKSTKRPRVLLNGRTGGVEKTGDSTPNSHPGNSQPVEG